MSRLRVTWSDAPEALPHRLSTVDDEWRRTQAAAFSDEGLAANVRETLSDIRIHQVERPAFVPHSYEVDSSPGRVTIKAKQRTIVLDTSVENTSFFAEFVVAFVNLDGAVADTAALDPIFFYCLSAPAAATPAVDSFKSP